ncbi:MAG: stage 0 sporulation family protein [Acidobacteria bacterium]|nr:stage 0 sporulation family protein [Acidobacteriota bacterium]MYJ06053.1 stage 0 sporulation family protein [Acidobacteriota bacterium]
MADETPQADQTPRDTPPRATPPFVSVKFEPVGRVHRFLLEGVAFEPPLQAGDDVVVTHAGARAYARVVRTIPQLAEREAPPGAGAGASAAAGGGDRVIRRATESDITARFRHQHRERTAHQFCALKIREHRLPMKLVRTELQVDEPHLTFYFTSDSRVDFRDLIRALATEFHCRIEMRQIGVRDEAKLLGGYGVCGRPLCCTTWLPRFEPISIKMAKQQSLNLNPSRLSGVCGRLKCCLRYELPNAAGEQYAGCAHESSCSRAAGGCGGGGGCGSSGGGCGNCSGGCGSG